MRLRLQRKVEQAELIRRAREPLGPQVVTPCELHPGWRMTIPPTKLAPPPHLCPYCRKEGEGHRSARADERVVANPAEIGTPLTLRQLDLQQLYEERHEPDAIRPGSPEEQAALERIDGERDVELESFEPKPFGPRSRFITGRIEGGEWVEWHQVPGYCLARIGASR